MTSYTVAVREKGKGRPFQFIVYDGEMVILADTTHRCKPLTRPEAELAKRLLIDGAKGRGRPIEARVVRLLS